MPYRRRTIAAAHGRVLEIGIGSGLKLPRYLAHVHEIVGLEPVPRLTEMARPRADRTGIRTTFIQGFAEAIPLEDQSVDTVVTTWTL